MSLKKEIVGKIAAIFPGRSSVEESDLLCYAYDATARVHLPDAVVFPETADEIARLLLLANEEGFSVIPRGSGSGTTGGSLAVKGGVVVVMTRMSRIIEIDRDNLIAHVEPGVITGVFHKAVEKEGLFYPPDPSSAAFSTLGGNMAECAGGPRAVKYGVTRDYVLGLEVVLPTGEIVKTGVQTAKGVVGYDLTRLMVGSEGTLGIITRITVRLLPKPSADRTMTALFDSMDRGAETVSEIIRRGVVPRCIEYMDSASIGCVESLMKKPFPEGTRALLIIEVDGEEDAVERELAVLKEICEAMGALSVKSARDKTAAKELWKARKSMSPALFRLAPDKINEDIVVPRSRIPDVVRKIQSLREETGLTMVSFGHAGDGNIHFNIMLDKGKKEDLEKAERAVSELFDYTLELGGTISGEHGVGITKAPYLSKEIGEVEMDLMKRIKQLFDPNGVLNPGKIFKEGKGFR